MLIIHLKCGFDIKIEDECLLPYSCSDFLGKGAFEISIRFKEHPECQVQMKAVAFLKEDVAYLERTSVITYEPQ